MITLSRISVFVTVSPITLIKIIFHVFFHLLEVMNGPLESYKLFHFIKSISKLYSPVPFQNKVAEIRVESLGRTASQIVDRFRGHRTMGPMGDLTRQNQHLVFGRC